MMSCVGFSSQKCSRASQRFRWASRQQTTGFSLWVTETRAVGVARESQAFCWAEKVVVFYSKWRIMRFLFEGWYNWFCSRSGKAYSAPRGRLALLLFFSFHFQWSTLLSQAELRSVTCWPLQRWSQSQILSDDILRHDGCPTPETLCVWPPAAPSRLKCLNRSHWIVQPFLSSFFLLQRGFFVFEVDISAKVSQRPSGSRQILVWSGRVASVSASSLHFTRSLEPDAEGSDATTAVWLVAFCSLNTNFLQVLSRGTRSGVSALKARSSCVNEVRHRPDYWRRSLHVPANSLLLRNSAFANWTCKQILKMQ